MCSRARANTACACACACACAHPVDPVDGPPLDRRLSPPEDCLSVAKVDLEVEEGGGVEWMMGWWSGQEEAYEWV